jgi:phosphatidylserine/phosphatidylglycerophosphate/cardiolipin synthase-like enzyme
MTLSDYAIQQIVPYLTGDNYPPKRSGPDLVKLFNKFGARDIYDFDNGGLPEIGKSNGHRPSRKQYVEARLKDFSSRPELRDLLNQVINDLQKGENTIDELNAILNPEKFSIVQTGETFILQGGIIDKRKPVINQAHFQDIQNKILHALDNSKVSIRIAMAWFTNETLFNKLKEKHRQGIDVEIAIYNDGVNQKHGVEITQLPHKIIAKGKRGGLMHDKFCVIDNQVVVSGSYNWTNNAEFRNDENITVEHDPEQATRFSIEYRRLTT